MVMLPTNSLHSRNTIFNMCFSLFFSNLRSVDATDSKQFQELLLEHSKTFAAQAQNEKTSSNADGEYFKNIATNSFQVANCLKSYRVILSLKNLLNVLIF